MCAYEEAEEFHTHGQLKAMKSTSNDQDLLLQALLVRERILGPTNFHMAELFYARGFMFAEKGEFSKCVSLWQKTLLTHFTDHPNFAVYCSSLTCVFSVLINTLSGESYIEDEDKFRDVCSMFRLVVSKIETHTFDTQAGPYDRLNNYSRLIRVAINLMSFLAGMTSSVAEEDESQFKLLVKQLVNVNPLTSSGKGLLHLAVDHRMGLKNSLLRNEPTAEFPCTHCVKLLLEFHVPLNTVDRLGVPAFYLARVHRGIDYRILIAFVKAGLTADSLIYKEEDHFFMNVIINRFPWLACKLLYIDNRCNACEDQ